MAKRQRTKTRKLSFKQELLALPNLLTYFRIVLIPAVVWFLWMGDRVSGFVAVLLYGMAAITDFIDGYIARKQHLVTVVGKFLDPLADKLLVISLLLVLMIQRRVPMWLVMIIIAREITITALRALASSEGLIIAAKPLGKYKTAFQMLALIGLMIHYEYIVNMVFFIAKIDFHRTGLILLYISFFFSIASAVDYFVGFFRAHKEKLEDQE